MNRYLVTDNSGSATIYKADDEKEVKIYLLLNNSRADINSVIHLLTEHTNITVKTLSGYKKMNIEEILKKLNDKYFKLVYNYYLSINYDVPSINEGIPYQERHGFRVVDMNDVEVCEIMN